MPDHISTTALAIGLVITFCFRFVALMTFLWLMIKIQKLNYTLLPLLGAALLASALDMMPLVGHFIAVPVLYFCIWKITRADLVPDATFTVALAYAMTRGLGWILLAYAPMPGLHTASTPDNFDDATNAPAVALVQTTNQVADTATAPEPANPPDNKIASDISVRGVSGGANNALVTIQYGKKDYVISLGEGTTISTDEGLVSVRFLEADGNNVKLAVNGQPVKYSVN
ncbi:MAG TPA: hypothetical protein VK811_06665 [Candidatus Acidoferrum sp.]|jgi:hypothetical protein|nr:hypothetical protein [Candidatus Acidoferrum sp.]